jgi:hypothetical protein
VEACQPRCIIFIRPVYSYIFRKVACYALDALVGQLQLTEERDEKSEGIFYYPPFDNECL